MEAAPAAAFEVTEPDLLLELTVIALDPPAQLGQTDQIRQGRRLGQRGQPVFGRSLFGVRPFNQEPLLATAFRGSVWCTRRGPVRRQSARTTGRPSPHATSPCARPPSADRAPVPWPRPVRARRGGRVVHRLAIRRGPLARGPHQDGRLDADHVEHAQFRHAVTQPVSLP